ncbi:MAG: glycosyltransferase [Symploca sp. SIO2C1]|nr:glycosyltransferase [Symploca sp. SIO2C1]
MTKPEVTLVVSPHERFSYTRQSLESIYEHTSYPFSLIYVDGGSPPHVKHYLERQAQEKGFELIRTDYYLCSNQARNLGLHQVKTEYVVFIDNDIDVAPGWLEKLMRCAQQTEATVVSPLTCISNNLHETIHLAGGEAWIYLQVKGDKIKRKLHEKLHFLNCPIAEVQTQLKQQQSKLAHFHCMLVRTSIFDQTGFLDEGLLSTREDIDFCLSVAQVGGTIYFEPTAVVTYVPGPPFELSDIPYFMLRWSDAWEVSSLEHFTAKWNLKQDQGYITRLYKGLGERRHQVFLQPLLQNLSLGQCNPWLEQMLLSAERQLNRYFTHCYYNPI